MGRALLVVLVAAGCAEPTTGNSCELASETGVVSTDSGASTVIYLNRDGGRITGGPDSSGTGASSIVANHGYTDLTITPARFDDTAWNAVVTCVRRAYARFDVEIVDRRPTSSGYVMAMFGGTGAVLGLGADSQGIAPLTCGGTDNAIAFVFTDTIAHDIERSCEVAAHEIAHTFGVDHQLLAADLSSYLPFAGQRTFQDVDAACGESTPRACICGDDTQNTVATLLDRLGPARGGDRDPPSLAVELSASRPGSTAIRVHINDASQIGSVTLSYRDDRHSFQSVCGDGKIECRTWNGISTFVVPEPVGHAVLSAEVVDVAGNAAASVPLELGKTPRADAIDVAVEHEGRFAQILVEDAMAVEVVAFWTDASGVTQRHVACEGEHAWTLEVEVADVPGDRTLVVQTTDAAGNIQLASTTLTIQSH